MMNHPSGPEVLIEGILIQVCVGEHHVIMHFDNDMSVSIESEINTDAEQVCWSPPRMAGTALITFLGRAVDNAWIDDQGDLVIAFETGRVQVRLLPNGGESFQITGPGIQSVY